MPVLKRITIHKTCLVAMITIDNSTLDFPDDDSTPFVCPRCRPHYAEARQSSLELIERAMAFVDENTTRFWDKNRRGTDANK